MCVCFRFVVNACFAIPVHPSVSSFDCLSSL